MFRSVLFATFALPLFPARPPLTRAAKLPAVIQKIARDGRVPLTVVRAGKELKLDVAVAARRPMLIPDLDGAYP